MGADHHGHVGLLEECIQVVCAKQGNVVLFLRVTNEVVLEAILVLVLVRVRPKQVNNFLVLLILILTKLDLQGSLDGFNRVDVLDSWTNATMATEDLSLLLCDNGCKWHVLESLVNLGKD